MENNRNSPTVVDRILRLACLPSLAPLQTREAAKNTQQAVQNVMEILVDYHAQFKHKKEQFLGMKY